MKCPKCDNEMRKGYLQTGGNNIIWDKKTHSIIVQPSSEGIQLCYRPLGSAFIENVYHCEKCGVITFEYDK